MGPHDRNGASNVPRGTAGDLESVRLDVNEAEQERHEADRAEDAKKHLVKIPMVGTTMNDNIADRATT